MTEEFEGNLPEIEISCGNTIFYYFCVDRSRMMGRSCMAWSKKCYDCLGLNPKFIRYYRKYNNCSCGRKLDFGYFMIIFCLENAGLLPKDYKMECCKCKTDRETRIDGERT